VKHAKRIARQRQRRCWRVGNQVKRYATRPRLAVFRSHKHICAQVIDDAAGKTLAAASSLEKSLRESVKYGGNKDAAGAVGKVIAERALAAGITKVAFDRRRVIWPRLAPSRSPGDAGSRYREQRTTCQRNPRHSTSIAS